MEDSFVIEQNLTFREFFLSSFNYYIAKKVLKMFLLILLAFSVLEVFLGIITINNLSFPVLVGTFAPIVVIVFLLITLTFLVCFFTYKSKPYLFQNVSYEFTHWGVVRNGEKTDFSKPWRDFEKFKETKEFFLLYIANTDFHIIQKRMFKDFDEMERFRALLTEKIA